jgi:hypothetical protein
MAADGPKGSLSIRTKHLTPLKSRAFFFNKTRKANEPWPPTSSSIGSEERFCEKAASSCTRLPPLEQNSIELSKKGGTGSIASTLSLHTCAPIAMALLTAVDVTCT